MELKRIRLRNFLSFGNSMQELELSELNIIVGPNDSGKTNVFRAIELISNLLNERMTPAEAYYHNRDFEHPFEIEIDVKFNDDEKEALKNYFVCSCFYERINVQQGENEEAAEKILRKIVRDKGNELFSDFCDDVTIVVVTEGKTRYPAEFYFKITKNKKTLFYRYYSFSKKPSKRGSHSLVRLQSVILSETRKRFPKLKDFLIKNKGKLPDFKKLTFSLYDLIYDMTNEKLTVDTTGFQLNEYEANRGSIPEFIRLRDFIKRTDSEEEGASFAGIISILFRKSIIKTTDIRSRPKPILDPKDLLYEKEMINLSGENLPKVLHSLSQNDDPRIKGQFREICSQFKKITRGLEIDVVFRPKIVKVTDRHVTEMHDDFGTTRLNGANPLGVTNQTKEITKQELGIQILKKGIPIPIEFASAGIIELMVLLTALIGQQNKIILLDEPALNLHSILQRRVIQLINNAVNKNNNQVIMITHSPFLLNPENFEKTWKFTSSKKGTEVINLQKIMRLMRENEQKRLLLRLHSSEVRGILFQHGLILVEGPSDKIVLEKTDRYFTDNELDGPNIEENEWMVLDVGGKSSLPLIVNLVKKLKIPYTTILDYDSLMQCNTKIKINNKEVKTSSVIACIEQTERLSDSEKKIITNIEDSIISKVKKSNGENKIQFWYNSNVITKLNKIAKHHSMYVLTKDLEGVIQNHLTSKESKPLKALEKINSLLLEGTVPNEIKSVMKFIQSKIEKETN